MLTINIITLFPQLFDGFLSYGLVATAVKNKKVKINIINPRDFAEDVHSTIDDKPFGGGDGMLMLGPALEKCLEPLKSNKVIGLSPQGKQWNFKLARQYSKLQEITLVCGRFAGIDQRACNQFINEEISIGDYVLNGGEVGAFVLIETMSRFVSGFMNNDNSASRDSFEEEGLLEAPQFTRPRVYNNQEVPEVLMSGHHKKINEWKKQLSLVVTQVKRPDIIVKNKIDKNRLIRAFDFVLEMPEPQIKSCGLKKENLQKERDQIGK